jgi:hypothetical protein
MKHCKHCNDTLFTEIYDTCMTCYEKLLAFQSTCFEKQPTESTMTKTIEQYQQDALWYQNEIKRLIKIYNDQQEILDKILFELPVGNVTSHSYENIPERVKYYVREHSSLANDWESAIDLIESSWPKFFHSDEMTITQTVKNLIKMANDGALSAWAADEATETLKEDNQNLLEKLEALKVKSRLFKEAQDGQEYLRCLHQEGDKHQSVGLWILDCLSYKESLEGIIKRPRKSETCRLIAQKALGLLSDDEYQPELLIEENLKLKMKIEDLQAVIDSELLNKVFTNKV